MQFDMILKYKKENNQIKLKNKKSSLYQLFSLIMWLIKLQNIDSIIAIAIPLYCHLSKKFLNYVNIEMIHRGRPKNYSNEFERNGQRIRWTSHKFMGNAHTRFPNVYARGLSAVTLAPSYLANNSSSSAKLTSFCHPPRAVRTVAPLPRGDSLPLFPAVPGDVPRTWENLSDR